MSHENADIMIDVVQLINELIDEDAGVDNEDEDDETEGREEAIKSLVDAFVRLGTYFKPASTITCTPFKLSESILELLVENLPRLNEAEESDRQGVFDILGECSHLVSFESEFTTERT